MAEFQFMADTKVPASLVTVVGSVVPLKVIPGKGEALPAIAATPESIAKVTKVTPHTRANFSTFHLEAVAAGKASLTATVGAKSVAGPIAIEVESALVLPAHSTNAGILTRLFLAECPGPGAHGYSVADATEAMTWMRVVVENRLAKPSAVWGSKGAKTLADVVKASNPDQFKGFTKYPTIVSDQQNVIDDALKIANDGSDTRRAKFKAFVGAALAVAALKTVTDPCPTGLYFWRTANSGKPSPEAKVYMTKLGNTFYTV